MTNGQKEYPPVVDLVSDLCNGDIAANQLEELDRLLRTDDDSLQLYIEYLDQEAELILHARQGEADAETWRMAFEDGLVADDNESQAECFPYVVISPLSSPTNRGFLGGAYHGAVGYFSQELPLSLLISTAVMAMAILLAWGLKLPQYRQIAELSPQSLAPSIEPENAFVGQITGLVNCRWADQSTRHFVGAYIPLGRKYDLQSGIMEITYATGAKVILEGPCTYKVESAVSGYLTQGKLTARVEKKEKYTGKKRGRGKVAHRHLSAAGSKGRGMANHESPAPIPRPQAPLFSVRTPTAVVTDLGTEFGVYVDRSGACETYVYQGRVELKIDGDEVGKHTVQLGRGESAHVNSDKAQPVKVNRKPGQTTASKFLRHMPGLVRLEVFNTGMNLREGDEDLQWQIVARSDDPGFKPRPAVVIPCHESYWQAGNTQSQWISIVPGLVSLPEDVTYTFRTTFRLPRSVPGKTVLNGKFMADDHVEAIRLNGQNLDLPRHAPGEGAYRWFHRFKTQDGFVEGVNVLEVDVLNGGCSSSVPGGSSYMAMRVELSGVTYTYGLANGESEISEQPQNKNLPEENQDTKVNASRDNDHNSAAFEIKTKLMGLEKGGEFFHHAPVFGTAAVARVNDGNCCDNYQRRCVYG